MPRQPRIDIPNGVHHVMNRGLERRDIVRSDDDRNIWWSLFERVALRCQWRVFAVALLNNHFHIYLRTPLPNLSDGMRDLDGGYASVFNQRHDRDGPLYRGRFKSVLVEHESHSWELSRYVHLNPFRARLTDNLIDYRWCSYRFFLNARTAPEWLDWRTVLAEFGGTESAARIGYKRFVESGMGAELKNPFPAWDDEVEGSRVQNSQLAGDSVLVSPTTPLPPILNFERATLSLDKLADVVCEVFSTTLEELTQRGRHRHAARDAAVFLAREWLSLPLDEIAARFQMRTRSSVSEAVRRTRSREEEDAGFRVQLATIRERMRAR
jgi:REP element-mobilizing transposase RayT